MLSDPALCEIGHQLAEVGIIKEPEGPKCGLRELPHDNGHGG
jgi:hypothetical protein